MAPITTIVGERRRHRRRTAEEGGWKADALLRPGLLVRILNITPNGVLLESPARLRPGRRAELQLTTADGEPQPMASGRITRCAVVAVSPMVFRGAIAFDIPVHGKPSDE